MEEAKKYVIELKVPRKGAAIFDGLRRDVHMNRDPEKFEKATSYIMNRLKDEFSITDALITRRLCGIIVELTKEQAELSSKWFWVKRVYPKG